MISELNDQEILDFLMTSDFEGDYSPEELKYLLVKWRYFYRLLNGKLERAVDEIEFNLKKSKEVEESNDYKTKNLQQEVIKKDETIYYLKNKKLNWKERISGKIIHIENENK
jgi:hypothetical protein